MKTTEKRIEVILDVFTSNALQNDFMHASDVFEQSKQLASHDFVKISGTPEMNFEKMAETVVNAYKEAGQNVVFVCIRMIDGVWCNKYPAYLMQGVNSISNGNQWGLFKDMLETLGYHVEYNERMQVLSAKLIINEPVPQT